jgi:polyhydroxyalkanoate synthesis repressor PhaR
MSDPRVIKKYPNRRLYDTVISSYVTLEDVKRLVLDRTEFRVVDVRSNVDITRSILLQIISEQEEQGNPIFSTEVLAQIIRFYGDTLQGMMANYLEKSLQVFVEQQHLVREQLGNFMGKNPLAIMSGLAERNLALWQAMNERLYKQQKDDEETAQSAVQGDDAVPDDTAKYSKD